MGVAKVSVLTVERDTEVLIDNPYFPLKFSPTN